MQHPKAERFKRIFMDEIHDCVIPHPNRVAIWRNFHVQLLGYPLQRIWLTATHPPHLHTLFLKTVIASPTTPTIRASTDRPELGYHCVPVSERIGLPTAIDRLTNALETVLKPHERMMIFFQDTDVLKKFASAHRCAYYHSGLDGQQKDHQLALWDSGKTKTLAATTAAAQGFDRAYVKFVLIYATTFGGMTAYQIFGRGGRAGQPCYVFIVYQTNVHQVTRGPLMDTKDPHGLSMLSYYTREAAVCRRLILTRYVDGAIRGLTCHQVLGAIPCDNCAPTSEMAMFVKVAIRYNRIPSYPVTPEQRLIGLGIEPQRWDPGPCFINVNLIHKEKTLEVDDSFFDNMSDDISPSMLQELDAIEQKVCPRFITVNVFY